MTGEISVKGDKGIISIRENEDGTYEYRWYQPSPTEKGVYMPPYTKKVYSNQLYDALDRL